MLQHNFNTFPYSSFGPLLQHAGLQAFHTKLIKGPNTQKSWQIVEVLRRKKRTTLTQKYISIRDECLIPFIFSSGVQARNVAVIFFFFYRGVWQCAVLIKTWACVREKGVRGTWEESGETGQTAASLQMADAEEVSYLWNAGRQRWDSDEMRSLLLPLPLLLEASGCTDLLEVWLMNHTWALKYRGVFMACSTGARIYPQQNFRPPQCSTALCAAPALSVSLSGIQHGTLAIKKKKKLIFFFIK